MADENRTLKLFGYEIKKSSTKKKEDESLKSVVPPTDEDGEGYVTASGSHFGQYINLDGEQAKDAHELIMKYRGVAMHPEVDMAVDEIVNESISSSELRSSVEISMESEKISESIKKKISEEFDNIVYMSKFNELGYEMFRSWYIDGRLYHHLVVDDKNLSKGIQEIRHIEATKIKKIREVKYKKDEKTGVNIVDRVDEYYVYEEKNTKKFGVNSSQPVRFSKESISYVTSGLLDENKKKVISHLHKSLKAVNQLRMMEDSLVIYRLARAPERRIFYIDIGNMSKGKSESYMRSIMSRYRNKLVYDASTGQIKDDRKHMSMLEDFWLPRREGGRGTEIQTLPGGQNLGEIEDIIYFQKNLYRSLNVPINRLEQEAQFSLGRSTEITRDELKFQKFVDRLRRRFSKFFLEILKKQLILKKIVTEEDWEEWKDEIFVDFVKDNHFKELKEMEILRERLGTLNEISTYVGEYFSKEWVMRNVLRFNDNQFEEMKKQIDDEKSAGEIPEDEFAMENEPVATQTQSKKENPPEDSNDQDETKPKPKKKDSDQSSDLSAALKSVTGEQYKPTAEDELNEMMVEYMNKILNK